MSNAQQAMHTYEAQLNENAAKFTQQHISQAEQDMNARFELKTNEIECKCNMNLRDKWNALSNKQEQQKN
jgi:hypothetical protein